MQFHVRTSRAPPRVEYIPIWVTLNPHFVSNIVILEFLHRKPPFDVSSRHLLSWETWMSSLYLLSLLPRNGHPRRYRWRERLEQGSGLVDREHQLEVLQAVSTMKERPNRDALNRAVDIFRDAMRPFIVRKMRQVHGGRVQEAILESLQGRGRDDVKWSLEQGKSIEDSIDVGDFPHIVQNNWSKVFRSAFKGDQVVKNTLWQIVDARNKAAHPGPEDLGLEYVRSRLYDIADMLGRIDAPVEKRAVEEIRDRLPLRPDYPRKNPETPHRPTPTPSPDRSSYWLNTIMTPVVLHKGTCMYVKKYAGRYPGHWTEYPTKDAADAAGRSTLRRVQDCGICF